MPSERIKRCENLLLISAIIIGTLILGFGASLYGEPGFYRILPFNNAGIEMIVVFLLIIIFSILGGLLLGYILGPLFLFIHKTIIGRNKVYVIQEKPEPEALKGTFKTFFPALLAVHLALLFGFNQQIIQIIVVDPEGLFAPTLTIILIIIGTSFLSFSFFSPIWFLTDSGIVYSNRDSVKDKRDPIEVKSVGGWFMGQLRGYAAIAVVVTYITFFIEMVIWFGSEMNFTVIIVLLLFPFILAVLGFPAIILLEFTVNHRKKFMLKVAEKMGINIKVGDPLKEL